jgi:hypothetical protein
MAHLGLSSLVIITKEDQDRVWGWPKPELETYCKENGWYRDPHFAADAEHGDGTRSYREPDGVRPAMQMCFHPYPPGEFVEIDYDYAAPQADVESALIHLGEVVSHDITHGKTSQERIAQMLDRRFGNG